jgi:hypothetical protein
MEMIEQGVDHKRADRALAFGAALLQFNYGLRNANTVRSVSSPQATKWAKATLRPGSSEELERLRDTLLQGHALRADDVQLGFTSAEGDEVWMEGSKWRLGHPVSVLDATLFGVSILTSKPDQNGQRPVRHVARASNSTGKAHLCRIMGRMAMFGMYTQGGELFFSRPALKGEGRHAIRSKDTSKLAKDMGSCAGLPATLFSSKSFKKSGISAVRETGILMEQAAPMMGHASTSSHQH